MPYVKGAVVSTFNSLKTFQNHRLNADCRTVQSHAEKSLRRHLVHTPQYSETIFVYILPNALTSQPQFTPQYLWKQTRCSQHYGQAGYSFMAMFQRIHRVRSRRSCDVACTLRMKSSSLSEEIDRRLITFTNCPKAICRSVPLICCSWLRWYRSTEM